MRKKGVEKSGEVCCWIEMRSERCVCIYGVEREIQCGCTYMCIIMTRCGVQAVKWKAAGPCGAHSCRSHFLLYQNRHISSYKYICRSIATFIHIYVYIYI